MRNKKRIIFFSILLFLSIGAFSPFGCNTTITGIVTDTQDQEIKGATVTIADDFDTFTSSTTTNSNGEYGFEDVPYNDYTITVTANGYDETQKTISTSYIDNGIACKAIKGDIKISPNTTIFEENFENCSDGVYTTSINSIQLYTQAGTTYYIDSSIAYSGDKSFCIEPSSVTIGWGTILISDTGKIRCYEICVRGNKDSSGMIICFGIDSIIQLKVNEYEGDFQITMDSDYDNPLIISGITYSTLTWYKIKLRVNTNSKTFNIWINDNYQTNGTYDGYYNYSYDALQFFGYGFSFPVSNIWFDEIKVYTN